MQTRHKKSNTFLVNGQWSMVKCSKRGFSLLELLIYIAILSGLMVVISDAFISLSKGRGQAEAKSEVDSSLRFAIERIRQDVKNASGITTPVLGTSSSTLAATVSGTTITYDVLAGVLRRKEGAATPVPVSGTNILAGTPTFTRLENYNSVLNATTTTVQVLMTFQYNSSSTDWKYSDTLRTTVSLR